MLSIEMYTATSLLPNQATKNSCQRVTNSKVKYKVIFSEHGLLFISNGMISLKYLVLAQQNRMYIYCSGILHNDSPTKSVLQMRLLPSWTESTLKNNTWVKHRLLKNT